MGGFLWTQRLGALWQAMARTATRARRRGRARPPRRFGLGFDLLETRVLPAVSGLTPLTWDVIGLDSNDVNVGPNTFLVGVRVRADAAGLSNLVVRFVEDLPDNPLVSPVGPTTLTAGSVAPSASQDFYFRVAVTRDAAAYDTVQAYHFEAFQDLGGDLLPDDGEAVFPLPGELYVEHLLSQSRNDVTGITIAGKPPVDPANPQPVTVFVGETLTVTVTGGTATNGYEELVFQTSFPTDVFQILSVSQSYSIPLAGGPDPNDRTFADAGVWDYSGPGPGTPTNTNNLTNKVGGGTISSTYVVRVIGTGSGSLVSLIDDFSGSSFHYNADYSTGVEGIDFVRFQAVAGVDLQVSKTDGSPTYTPGGTVTYSVVVSNAGPGDVTGAVVTDPLPAQVSAATWTAAYTGGGSGPAGGSGNLVATVNLPAGAAVTFTITATIRPDATGDLVNTASVAPPEGVPDLNPGNNSATDIDTLPAPVGPPPAPPTVTPLPLGPAAVSSVTGVAFLDGNRNGNWDPGEPVVPFTLVVLTGTDDLGRPVTRSVVTGADGRYTFAGLRAGSYSVQVLLPARRGGRRRWQRSGLARDFVLPPGVSREIDFPVLRDDALGKSMFLASSSAPDAGAARRHRRRRV
jgi:uncharacterized repeat protein (TIGR01451 family)